LKFEGVADTCPLKHNENMRKRAHKPDINQIAASIVAAHTNGANGITKNPAAVALGRLGGLKGGKARAEHLSAARRKQIARKAAKARWIKPS
jgi:hypothetical protein